MTLLLDTSILVALEREDSFVKKKIGELSESKPPFISFISLFEFLYGLESLPLEKKANLKKFLWKFSVLHTTNETAMWLSYLKYCYVKQGKQKSLSDLFIASQALEHKLTLVTRDKDFEDISEIKKIMI